MADQVFTENQLLERVRNTQEMDWDRDANIDLVTWELVWIGKCAAYLQSEKLKDALLAFDTKDVALVESAKLTGLNYLYEMDGGREFIISRLQNQEKIVQAAVVKALLEHGEPWSLVEPIIKQNKMYGLLGGSGIKEAIPFLQEGMSTGTWGEKMTCATVLESFGFKNARIEAAEDILQNSPLSEDPEILRPVHISIGIARRYNLTYLATSMARFATSENALVSGDVVTSLMTFAKNDNSQVSILLLQQIATQTKDEYLAKRIQLFIQNNDR